MNHTYVVQFDAITGESVPKHQYSIYQAMGGYYDQCVLYVIDPGGWKPDGVRLIELVSPVPLVLGSIEEAYALTTTYSLFSIQLRQLLLDNP
jgi:hypothetical protein